METKELLIIETADLSLYIKGLPYDRKYTNLRQYRKQVELEKETMVIRVHGEQMEAADVLNVETGELEFVQSNKLAPIFFENGIYQLVLTPKREKHVQFYHEHPGIRNSISPVGTSGILMGNLQFTNEVGLTNFSFYSGKEKLLEVTLEIFPSKLSYKEDYRKLLEEVNDEVYNLAFHFIKKTYLNASSILSENPSPTEFFRLLEHYFLAFEKAIRKIEQQPHHQLITEHEMVRGDRIKRLDSKGRQFLRKHPPVFEDSPIGFFIEGRTFLPTKGINTNKRLSFNTLENRFVKWMIERLLHKLTDLKQRVLKRDSRFQVEVDEILVNRITYMVKQLEKFLQKSFWKEIGSIDRTVLNMVMQSKMGYREAYKIYLIVSRGLSLQGELYKMSVKGTWLRYMSTGPI